MKNKDKVAELIAALKAEAETEFELHRISVLERDLLEGMPKVNVVDDTHQSFSGHIYRKDHTGYYSRTEMLHVTIMERYIGDSIPQGYEVHHNGKDKEGHFTKNKNDIEDLLLLSKPDHSRLHAQSPRLNKYICKNCKTEYYAIAKKNNCFCSRKCLSAWQYRNKKTLEIRKCIICGKNFETYKYHKTVTCSKKCTATWMSQLKKAPIKIKKCEYCGKDFKLDEHLDQRFCSHSCAAKMRYKENHEEKICPICGKYFEVTQSARSKNRKCCSRSCSIKFVWNERKKNR